MFIAYLNLFMIIYTGYVKPKKLRLSNNIELFNEFMISTVSIHMLFFTDRIDKAEDQYKIGFFMIALICLMMSLSLICVFYFAFKAIKLVCVKYGKRLCKKKSK